jgi:hypothetical protein
MYILNTMNHKTYAVSEEDCDNSSDVSLLLFYVAKYILNTMNQQVPAETDVFDYSQFFKGFDDSNVVSVLLFLGCYVYTQHDEPSDVCSQQRRL